LYLIDRLHSTINTCCM